MSTVDNLTKTPDDIVINALIESDPSDISVMFLISNPGPESEGNTFLVTLGFEDLCLADWEKANYPQIVAPAIGFVTRSIPGNRGVVDITELSPKASCQLVEVKKIGGPPYVQAVVHRDVLPSRLQVLDFTTIILRPDSQTKKLLVSTFFPGSATPPPSRLRPSEVTAAVKTVAHALELGVKYVKVAGQ